MKTKTRTGLFINSRGALIYLEKGIVKSAIIGTLDFSMMFLLPLIEGEDDKYIAERVFFDGSQLIMDTLKNLN
jgi:hypothetical protein